MQEEQDNYLEIDLLQLLKVIKRRALAIAASALACALVFLLVSAFLITPKYQAEAMMYINNNKAAQSDMSLNASDIQASQSLVDTCVAIINTRAVYDEVKKKTGVDYTYNELTGMVTAEAVNSTELLKITVESADPKEAAELANAYMTVASKTMMQTVMGSNTKPVDKATVPTHKSSPSIKKNTLIGFMLGLVASMGVVVLLELMNTVIRSEKELNEAVKDVPVLGVIPDFKALEGGKERGKYGTYEKSYGGYDKDSYEGAASGGRKGASETEYEKNGLLTGNMPFAFRESYKALRTNVTFSLPASERGRILGVTSADKGDGKSTNSMNTALSIAETGKKVLFLDCDLRLSMIAERLELNKTPGLSNVLVGACELKDAIQKKTFGKDNASSIDVITAGDFPPNPAELLNSKQMEDLCAGLTEQYDYIIVDLPPVEIVSDALVLSKALDGLMVVVREGKSEREEIRSTVNKIEFLGGKLLGFIYTNHYEKPKSGRYGKYGKYGKYGYGDYSKGYGYADSYAEAAEKASEGDDSKSE